MSSKMNGIRKIAVFRPGYLSELLCLIPAMRSLRAAFPEAEISLIGLPWALFFVRRFHFCFDRFIHFAGVPVPATSYLPSAELNDFIADMRKEQFDLILQLADGTPMNNKLVDQLGARYVAGYCEPGQQNRHPLVIPYPNHLRELRRHLVLMEHLQLPIRGEFLEFPLLEEDRRDFEALLVPLFPGKYICVHAGARYGADQWPAECFAALADHCAEQGFTIVLTGSNDETDLCAEVMKCMKHPAIDLSGKTSLGSLGYLISQAFSLISNCNGVAQLATALCTRSVVINLNDDFERWAPVNRSLHAYIDGRQKLAFDQVFMEVVDLTTPVFEPLLYNAGRRAMAH